MKKLIVTLVLPLFLMGALIISCDSSADKQVDNKKLTEPKQDSINMHQDTLAAYQNFINKSEERIKVYEENIAELKSKIAEHKKKDQANYEKKLALLEQKTKALEAKVIIYKEKKMKDWNEKQVEFKKDMDELGKAIANFFEKED